MGEEFNMYTAKVEDLGNTIAEQAQAYLDKVDEVTSIVNNLSSVWGGPTYDTFKANYDSNLANLEELNDLLKKIAGEVQNTASDAESMINGINSAMDM